MSLPLNQIIVGDCTEVMKGWPADSIDLVVTSPPYWGLRDYGADTVRVWGGDPECEHEWAESESGLVHENRNFSRGSQEDVHGEKETTWIRKYDAKKAGFCIKCGAWHGSLGLEPHPQMFIDHLVEICREIKRVLKPSGTFWLNLGDTYFSGAGKSRNPGGDSKRGMDRVQPASSPNRTAVQDGAWLQPKQLLGIPWRVAIALQNDGWLLRNSICWWKSNYMPSSVKDRLTNAYEPVFLFVKNNETLYWVDRFTGQLASSKPRQYYVHNETGDKRFDRPKREVDKDWFKEDETAKFKYAWQGHNYYFDLDAIRVPHQGRASRNIERTYYADPREDGREHFGRAFPWEPTIKGKNPGDIWQIPTTPFPGAHFATFPPKLIEPIVKAGSPMWVCSKCGKPRIRITEPTPEYAKKLGKSVHDHKDDLKRGMRYDKVHTAEYVTVGWSDCGCGEGWNPGVVMDPFGGSGTVGQVARRLGRRFILVEIMPKYADMARQRVQGKYKPIPEGVTPFTQEEEKVK